MKAALAPAHGARLLLAIAIGLLCAAPTPGDVGGCGQRAQELDPGAFFLSKAEIDCERCASCSISSQACSNVCDASVPLPTQFPDKCAPLVHDGEVCLRALLHSDCEAYQTYMRDSDPRVPSECDFCPRGGP